MFKSLDDFNTQQQRKQPKRYSTIVQRKQKTTINLTTQFDQGQWVNKSVEDAEDNLQEEFLNARKAVRNSQITGFYPDSYYEMKYQHCLFTLGKVNLNDTRDLNAELEVDAKTYFQMRDVARGSPYSQKGNKITQKFEEFNIKMQGRQLLDTMDMHEPPCEKSVVFTTIWRVPCTLVGSDVVPRIILME